MAEPKTKKSKRGLGRLYKRGNDGKEYISTSKKVGIFWLEYKEGGKRYRIQLEVDGEPVRDLKVAQQEQLRIRAPYLTGSKIEVYKKMQSEIDDLEVKMEKEEDQAKPPISIAESWDAFLVAPNRLRPAEATMKTYNSYWEVLVDWFSKKRKDRKYLRDITEEDAGAFMNHLDATGMSGNTYNKYLQFFKKFFEVLYKTARLTANPFEDIPREKNQSNSKRELTLHELQTIIMSAKDDLKLLLETGTFTGLRLGDCCTLRWEDIDLNARLIKKTPNKTARTTNKKVKVGIPDIFLQDLLTIPADQRSGYLLPRFAELYADRDNGQPKITKEIRRHIESCGIQVHTPGTGMKTHYEGKKKVYEKTKRAVVEVGFHSLRHTWVSLHAMSGTPQAVIQESVGHSNPAMTAHYTHTSDEAARKVASTFNIPELIEAIDVEAVSVDNKEPSAKDQLHKMIDQLSDSFILRIIEFIEKETN